MSDKPTGFLTLKEYCHRNGWPYPMPLPGTPEAERLIDRVLSSPPRLYQTDEFDESQIIGPSRAP